MSTARNRILDRLRAAKPTPIEANDIGINNIGIMEHTVQTDQTEALSQFRNALTANHAEVYTLEIAQLNERLHTLCDQKGWQHALIGTDGPYLNQCRQGLGHIRLSEFHQPLETWKTELFTAVDVGITHTLAGIADTGALVIWPGPAEPRTLSLVPPCHVAILNQSTLYGSFSEVMRAQQWQTQMPTNVVLVSGPSKTADIQQTLAYGAHGPGELIVLVVTDQ
jgi:L-lactate dehydrogenase complex protein LldG